ncbi:ATP-binding protein [Anatilimnocola sp. NA78]|uniref:ATP-binding protein n=1 Tax=Anatilimnocola sp. NA78 TaxID=3415683 RepID=UPI003CE4D39B
MAENIQHSLFEEGYLVRSLGAVTQQPDVALSELVANSWDAGSSVVKIEIPDELGGVVAVSDDGVGISPEQFRNRWMKLGYNRVKHQGEWAEFPPERKDWKRRAYGRNGIGRHGLLCFGPDYTVETKHFSAKEGHRFTVKPSSGESAFDLVGDEPIAISQHGTKVWTTATYNLPTVDKLRDSLSLSFLYDPQFKIYVNDTPITLEEYPTIAKEEVRVDPMTVVTVECKAVEGAKRRKISHGVAFWVGGRLVGEPNWGLHGVTFLDGRTSVANKHLIVVQSDDLFDEVQQDWTGFKRSPRIERMAEAIQKYVDLLVNRLMADKIQENKVLALRENRDEIVKLKPLARIEINEFVEQMTTEHPLLNVDVLSTAVKAAVNLEKSRSGMALLEKLATISPEDVDLINNLLDNWTLRDAMAVLDELDRRISVIEALSKLMGDPKADELHSIHPLVTQARWLFGPEYDSPMFSSNVTIRRAAEKVFKKAIDESAIAHPRQRPDLIFLKDATVSLVGTEEFSEDSTIVSLQRLLLIELKKGDAVIKLKHLQQAQNYVNDLLNCQLLDGEPFIQAFVVGDKVDKNLRPMTVGENPTAARIVPCSFGQLVRTAQNRLFRLNEIVSERYRGISGAELVNRVLGEGKQQSLFEGDEPEAKPKKKRARKKA